MDWETIGTLMIVLLGHSALSMAILNRVSALPWHWSRLDSLRGLWVALTIALALLLMWRWLPMEHPLSEPGSWGSLSLTVRAYCVLCVLSAMWLFAELARRLLAQPPAPQRSNTSRTVDLADELGRRPVGTGPGCWLATLPGNDLFRMEVAHKEFELSQLPKEWDGFSILHLSDLHLHDALDRRFFDRVIELGQESAPDLVLFTGDLLGCPAVRDWIPATVGRLHAPLGCYFILGNHDRYYGAPETRRQLQQLGWQSVAEHHIIIEHRGHRLLLAGTESPWMGGHPTIPNDTPAALRLLLSHTPDNLTWARRHGFDLMLAGHAHGGQVCLPLFGAVHVPAYHGCRYAAGQFYKPPTLLHVSRGIGSHPFLRWRCPPELPTLVLRTTN